jgi:hypothetical protein
VNWAALLRGLLGGLADFLKAIFGMDAPKKETVDVKPSPLPPDKTDAELLADLGVRIRRARGDADADGLHHRPDSGNAVHSDQAGPTSPDSGKRDG